MIPLTGSIAPQSYYLVEGGSGGTVGAALPASLAAGNVSLSATTGNVALASGAAKLACVAAACATDASVVDLVGYGTGAAFAGTKAAPAPSSTTSISRTGFANTADNAADFIAGAPSPAAAPAVPVDPGAATPATIAEIQGTASASPLAGRRVVTDGVVTAAYPTGGLAGFVIQLVAGRRLGEGCEDRQPKPDEHAEAGVHPHCGREMADEPGRGGHV